MCRRPMPSRCCSGCSRPVFPARRGAARVSSAVSKTPLKKRHSLNEPFGPPSPLDPLSETTTISVLSSFTGVFEEVDDRAQSVVVVRDEAGEDLGHADEQTLLVGRQRLPGADRVEQRPRLTVRSRALRLPVRIEGGQLGVGGEDAELDLPGQDLRPDGLISLVELPAVAVRPVQRHQMRGVTGLGCEVHEEGLVRVDDLGVLDEGDGLVREVVRQVVAVLGPGRRLGGMVVVDQVGVVAVGLAAQPAVEALETATERPPTFVGRLVALLAGCEMPLAHGVGVVAPFGENLGEEPAPERDPGRDARGSPRRTRRWWPCRWWSRCGRSGAMKPASASRVRWCGSW